MKSDIENLPERTRRLIEITDEIVLINRRIRLRLKNGEDHDPADRARLNELMRQLELEKD